MPFSYQSPPTLSAALCGYLLHALNSHGRFAFAPGASMPSDTIYSHQAETALSVTCVAPPMFRLEAHRLARALNYDVALIRCCLTASDPLPAEIEVTLARRNMAPFSLDNLAFYRSLDGELWLVPQLFTAAVHVTKRGFELELIPPYSTLGERADGIYRATCEISTLLYPAEAQ